jgi:hypothetical protein
MVAWADYFWPNSTVLRNKLGITDADVLHDAEYRLAAVRRTEIVRGLAPIAETYDAEHLKALHGWVFQDVYEWAGRVRDVPISKMTDFAPLDRIDGCLQNAAGLIAETRWQRLNDDRFAAAAAVALWIATSDRKERKRERDAADEVQAKLVVVSGVRLETLMLQMIVRNKGSHALVDVKFVSLVVAGHENLDLSPTSDTVLPVVGPGEDGNFMINPDGLEPKHPFFIALRGSDHPRRSATIRPGVKMTATVRWTGHERKNLAVHVVDEHCNVGVASRLRSRCHTRRVRSGVRTGSSGASEVSTLSRPQALSA